MKAFLLLSAALLISVLPLNAETRTCEAIQDKQECLNAGCAWYDLSHIPFGGGEKGCYQPTSN